MSETNSTINTLDVERNKDVVANFVKQSTLFTKREWIMRYASPFKALMFMAGPMVIIMLVNSLYGIVDKQLALNYAIDNVISMLKDNGHGFITGTIHKGDQIIKITIDSSHADLELFAKQLINVSTQYSNTLITLLSAMSLLTAVGTAIKWGQAMGERNKQRMDSILIMGLIQTLVISVLGIIILHFVGPYIITSQIGVGYGDREKSLIFMLSNQYTQMFIWGFPLLATATFISTLIRTEGKVWWVIVINLTAIVLNILCGELFMEHAADSQKMQAAVYGSFIAWGFMIAAGLLLITISKNTLLFPKFKNIKLKMNDGVIIWVYGLSPFLANFIFAVSNFITTYLITITHSDGESVKDVIKVIYHQQAGDDGDVTYITPTLRVMSSGFPWLNILYAPIIGMMEGANANYAYCKGAGKRYRMLQIWKIHLLINVIWGVLCLVLIAAAGGPMMEAFDGPAHLKWWFFAFICGIVFVGFTYTALSLFQGIGDARDATLIAIFRTLIFNISFVVIGWVIAKNSNPDGTQDWIIFVMSGLCEIPAAIATYILVHMLFKKNIKNYEVNDKADDFEAPTLLSAAENEVTMTVQSLSNKVNKRYDAKLAKVKPGSKKAILLEEERQIELDKIIYKSRIRRKKVEDKYRFDVQTYGKDNQDAPFKRLEKKEQIALFKATVKNSFDLDRDLERIIEIYADKRAKLESKRIKNNAYYEKLRNGEVKLTPLKLFFITVEPQPLSDLPERRESKEVNIKLF